MTDSMHSLEMREAHAQRIAEIAVKRFEPLRSLPERDAAGILMLGYRRRIEEVGISAREADYLLMNDLRRVMQEARPLVHPLPHLNEVRIAVVVHLAFVLGVEQVRRLPGFVAALKREDYDEAADLMLLSDWPTRVGRTDAERRRAIALVTMMRSGKLVAEARGAAA